jgi:hypothetical protein
MQDLVATCAISSQPHLAAGRLLDQRQPFLVKFGVVEEKAFDTMIICIIFKKTLSKAGKNECCSSVSFLRDIMSYAIIV